MLPPSPCTVMSTRVSRNVTPTLCRREPTIRRISAMMSPVGSAARSRAGLAGQPVDPARMPEDRAQRLAERELLQGQVGRHVADGPPVAQRRPPPLVVGELFEQGRRHA